MATFDNILYEVERGRARITLNAARRPAVPCMPPEERVSGFLQVEGRLADKVAIEEARRCLRCDLRSGQGGRWPRL
jgi:hypothetical protein